MRSECGLSMILHCLQWYKLLLRTRLSTAAVQYLVQTSVYRVNTTSQAMAYVELKTQESQLLRGKRHAR